MAILVPLHIDKETGRTIASQLPSDPDSLFELLDVTITAVATDV